MKLTIDRLGHLGDGIAQGPEGAVFVPGMLPGEEIEGDLQGSALQNVRIITPSASRIRPPCSPALFACQNLWRLYDAARV